MTNKLVELEEKEKLDQDCDYIRNVKRKMNQISIDNLEELRCKYVSENLFQLNIPKIAAITEFCEFVAKEWEVNSCK